MAFSLTGGGCVQSCSVPYGRPRAAGGVLRTSLSQWQRLRRSVARGAARKPLRVAAFLPASSSRSEKRTSDLMTRKLYLKNFYYAVGFGETTLKGKVQRVKILDMYVALWRDNSGAVHCVTDECPLTGAQLSDGSIVTTIGPDKAVQAMITTADRLATYDAATGELLRSSADALHSEPDFPATTVILPSGESIVTADGQQPRLEVWDCIEKGGFVWLFFGERDMPMSSRPPIPWVPELSEEGWRGVHGEVMIKGNHWMVMENVIDMAHVPYVHKGTVGNHAAFVDIEIDEMPTSLDFAFPIENLRPKGKAASVTVDVQATACMPSTSFIRFKFPFSLRLVTINSVVPVDEGTTVIRFCQMRNFAQTPLVDPLIRKGMENILGEDKVIIEMLRPEEVAQEISLKADSPQMAFRRMREGYIGNGDYVSVGPRPLHVVQSKA